MARYVLYANHIQRVEADKVLEYDILVSEFELQSHYYVHFLINRIGEGMNLPVPTSYGLNSIIAVLLRG